MRGLLRGRSFNSCHDSSKNTMSGRLDHGVWRISGFRCEPRQEQKTKQLRVFGWGTGSGSWRNTTARSSSDLPRWGPVWNAALFTVHQWKRANLRRLLQMMTSKLKLYLKCSVRICIFLSHIVAASQRHIGLYELHVVNAGSTKLWRFLT